MTDTPAKPLVIETSPAALDAARRLGDLHRAAVVAYLARSPHEVSECDLYTLRLFADPTSGLHSALITTASAPDKDLANRTLACVALLALGDGEGITLLKTICDSVADLDSFHKVDWALAFRIYRSDDRPLFQSLRSLPWLHEWTLHWVRQCAPGERHKLLHSLGLDNPLPPPAFTGTEPIPFDQQDVVWHTIAKHPHRTTFQAVLRTLEKDPNNSSMWLSLIAAGQQTPSDLVPRIVEIAHNFLRPEVPYWSSTFDLAIEAIEKIAPNPTPRFRAILLSDLPHAVRKAAGERITELHRVLRQQDFFAKHIPDATAREKLLHTNRPSLTASQDPVVLAALASLEPYCSNIDERSDIVRLMLDIGGPEVPSLAAWFLPNLGPDAIQRLRDLTSPDAPLPILHRALELNLISKAHHAALIAKGPAFQRENLTTHPQTIFNDSERTQVFDTESNVIPPRYDELLVEFATKSDGQFQPADIYQDYVDANRYNGPPPLQYTVQFTMNTRVYRFFPAANGDWIDVPPLATAINTALADAGETRRFLMLDPDGQGADFVFADPTALKILAAEFKIRLADNLDSAAAQGIAFENYARNLLGASDSPV